MSKRIQITLSEVSYEKLIELSEIMPFSSKSAIICASIDELYRKLDSKGFFNKKEPCR